MKLEEIKNKTKEATDYLVQSLEAGHSEVLTQYLAAMAKFHTYSFGNIMLIARQKSSATDVYVPEALFQRREQVLFPAIG